MHAWFSSWFYAADFYEKQRVADTGVIFSKDNYNLNGNIYHCILKKKRITGTMSNCGKIRAVVCILF